MRQESNWEGEVLLEPESSLAMEPFRPMTGAFDPLDVEHIPVAAVKGDGAFAQIVKEGGAHSGDGNDVIRGAVRRRGR